MAALYVSDEMSMTWASQGSYPRFMEVFECIQCYSPMVFRDGMWQCDNCFAVLTAESVDVDDVEIEEGVSMRDVMKAYERSERE